MESFWDKFVIAMTPTSSAPGWFYGIFLDPDFCGFIKNPPFWRAGIRTGPQEHFLYALSLCNICYYLLIIVPERLFLNIYSWAYIFLDLFQLRITWIWPRPRASLRKILKIGLYFETDRCQNIVTNFAPDINWRLGRRDRYRKNDLPIGQAWGRCFIGPSGCMDTPVIVGRYD